MITLEDGRYTPEALQYLFQDPTFLPSHSFVTDAFGRSFDYCGEDGDWRQLWSQLYDSGRMPHELLTKEYIEGLGAYLKTRAEKYATGYGPVRIVEVGAGDGQLAYFLQMGLSDSTIEYVATDSDEWGISRMRTASTVEVLGYQEAIEKYDPDILIASWKIPQQDWTASFRESRNLKEYILIGPADSNTCGDAQLTWGVGLPSDTLPSYMLDGFSRIDLLELRRFQLSFADSNPCSLSVSSTVSFRRGEPVFQTA